MVADGPPSQCRSETGEIGQAQKRHREVPEGGHSSRGRASTDLRPVLDEEHIADPLKRFSIPNRRLLLSTQAVEISSFSVRWWPLTTKR